jgi:uncharacterized protein (TIGR02118 family)
VIKFFFVLRRRPDLTPEQFHEYWKTTHGPMVAQLPGLVRYVQHHVVSVPRPEYAEDDPPIDGIVETWWESQEALARVQATPELRAVMEDEVQFMGHSNRYVHTLMVTESVRLVDHGPSHGQL